MTVLLNPYFNFKGEAREALEFYQGVFGGTLDTTAYSEMPPGASHGHEVKPDWLMHGFLHGDNGINIMAADAPLEWNAPAPTGTAISLSGDEAETIQGYWDKLADGGQITTPLAQALWGDTFGMLNDKFGVPWMVNILGPQHGRSTA